MDSNLKLDANESVRFTEDELVIRSDGNVGIWNGSIATAPIQPDPDTVLKAMQENGEGFVVHADDPKSAPNICCRTCKYGGKDADGGGTCSAPKSESQACHAARIGSGFDASDNKWTARYFPYWVPKEG